MQRIYFVQTNETNTSNEDGPVRVGSCWLLEPSFMSRSKWSIQHSHHILRAWSTENPLPSSLRTCGGGVRRRRRSKTFRSLRCVFERLVNQVLPWPLLRSHCRNRNRSTCDAEDWVRKVRQLWHQQHFLLRCRYTGFSCPLLSLVFRGLTFCKTTCSLNSGQTVTHIV